MFVYHRYTVQDFQSSNSIHNMPRFECSCPRGRLRVNVNASGWIWIMAVQEASERLEYRNFRI